MAPVPPLLYVVASTLLLGLGATLLARHWRHPPNLALAAVLVVRGLGLLLVPAQSAVAPATADAMLYFRQALTLALPPLAFLFLALYRADLRGERPSRGLMGASLAALVLVEAAYFLDARLFIDHSAQGFLPGQPRLMPLYFIHYALSTLICAGAFVLLRDATRLPSGPRRPAAYLVSFGFLLLGPLEAVENTLRVFTTPEAHANLVTAWGAGTQGILFVLLRVAAVPAVVALLTYACARAVRSADADTRGRLRWYAAAVLGVLAVSAGLASVPGLDRPTVSEFLFVAFLSTAPLVLGYALLRHRLYAVDARVGWTLRKSALLSALVGGALAVVTLAEILFPLVSQKTVWAGLMASTALLQGPLRRAARRLEESVVPPGPEPAPRAGQRLEEPAVPAGPEPAPRAAAAEPSEGPGALYRSLVARFWRDGALARGDRSLLARVREATGLDEAEALRIEENVALEAARALAPAAPPDARAPPRRTP